MAEVTRELFLCLQAAELADKLRRHADPLTIPGFGDLPLEGREWTPEERRIIGDGFRRLAAFRRAMGRWYRRSGMMHKAIPVFQEARQLRSMARKYPR